MPKKFTIATYDKKHKENLAKRAKKVQQLYDAAIKRIAQAAAPSLFAADAKEKKEFHFEDFPALQKEMNALMQDLSTSLQTNIEEGDEESWTLANTKNDAMVASVIGKTKLPTEVVETWTHPHLEALNAFIDRKDAGMNLSERVWNLASQFKTELELALELGIGEGKSAAELSKDVRQYLQYPDKLFRRVRDKNGVLRLSKAAKAFHPGRGVYRSSYKNALRMTATENNIAYRTADHTRWNALPFVLGIETHISNNHPTDDICDTFDGAQFPKEFKFTGWHPWCRCYAVSILVSQEEMDAYTRAIINGEDVSNWKFSGKVEKMPEKFDKWMEDNQQRIAKAKTMPYFIKDNFKDGDPAKGLRWKGKIPDQAKTQAKSKHDVIMENAAKRHATRTLEQNNEIRKQWSESRSNAAIVAKAKRTLTIANRYPSYSSLRLRRALDRNDYKRLSKITKEERNYLKEWSTLERKAIEAQITINKTPSIDSSVKKRLLSDIQIIKERLSSKKRAIFGGTREMVKQLEKDVAKATFGMSKTPTFIERLEAGETAEQLASRLGTDCPATLKNFAKTVNKLEKEVVGEFTEREIQSFRESMREAFKHYDFATNVPINRLEKIVDGHLKNQIETDTSLGLLDPDQRREISFENFGTPMKSPARQYEKYGSLVDTNLNKQPAASQYGGTTIRWKKGITCKTVWIKHRFS